MSQRVPLPIDALLPEIVARVQAAPLVLLEAEPGTGKTTRVPSALLDSGLADVYVLEPRRIAARMAARRVAEERGEPLGETVGYQVRYEEVTSPRTRLLFLTEGVLTRRLLSHGIGRVRVVVLDEFHERHLDTDLAFALLRNLQRARSDLRLVLMSATLQSKTLAERLGGAAIIKAAGRVFPVTMRYTPLSDVLEDQVAASVSNVLAEGEGHVLVFLPGAAEIRRCLGACEPIARKFHGRVLPLHGDLSPEEQDAAVAPSKQRKIICATNVAESSITIPGVDAVVDSGLARVLSYSPWTGIARLRVEKISKASAIQRSGRAGRTGPGIAVRLYPESDFARRPEEMPPEILRADLAQATLQIANAGLSIDALPWLDMPSAEHLQQARDLLLRLGAVRFDGTVTEQGRRLADLPVHPRLGSFVDAAANLDVLDEAARIAAIISEGRLRLEEHRRGQFASDLDALLQTTLSYNARRLETQLRKSIRKRSPKKPVEHALEKALLAGFGDRVAVRRGEVLLLSNGASARLDRASAVQSPFLVALEVEERDNQAWVRLAAAIQPDWLLDLFPDRITMHEDLVWNREAARVEQTNQIRYDGLLIDESTSSPTDRPAAAQLLAQKAIELGIEKFSDAVVFAAFLRRVHFAAAHSSLTCPEALTLQAVRHLAADCTSLSDLRQAARGGALVGAAQIQLDMRLVDDVAPTHINLPGGRRARIEYPEGGPPFVSSRLQDFFGMHTTPAVARGSVPLVVHLLAPNQRPIQVTTDLVSFWKNLYPQVRRELSRRYPRHAWPESPYS